MLTGFLSPENKYDIFEWILQKRTEAGLLSVKLKSKKGAFLFGNDIFLTAEIKNNSKECIAVYSQPYLFVVNGEKKRDNFVLVSKHSKKDILSNYLLFGQKKSGGIVWKPIEGDTTNHFYDISFPIEIVLRPGEKIMESIKIPCKLYEKYVTKDSIEICIWKSWRKYAGKLNRNIKREITLEENKYILKESDISLNHIFSHVTVENYVYFLHGRKKNKGKKMEYQLRYGFGAITDHLSVSNSINIVLIACRSPKVVARQKSIRE